MRQNDLAIRYDNVCKIGSEDIRYSASLTLPVDKPVKDPIMCFVALVRSCSHMAYAGAE